MLIVPETAQFDPTFRFIDITVSGIVTKLTPAAVAAGNGCAASLTIGTTTTDFSDSHGILFTSTPFNDGGYLPVIVASLHLIISDFISIFQSM
jgi:hypothetical protein